MSVKFVWEEAYSVGNSELDNQHKGLFELANQLPEVVSNEDARPVIMQLYKYTREHFAFEEEIMKESGFPLLQEHRQLHEEIISKLNAISSRKINDDEELYEFKKFFYDWLISHIMQEDNRFFKFKQS